MLADDDMTTGLVVQTDVEVSEGTNYNWPIWWVARDRAELTEERVDFDDGGDHGHGPMHGRQHEHAGGHSEEPLP